MIRSLSASQLLEVWERGQVQPSAQCPLLLLMAACPDKSQDELARLSIGQRDAWLLSLREWTFGPQLTSLTTCPHCGEPIELSFSAGDIRVEGSTESKDDVLTLHVDDYTAHFRLPNSLDLLAISTESNLDTARAQLLARCVLSVQPESLTPDEAGLPPDQWPDSIVQAITAGMAQADPQADTRLALSCPACAQQWQATFDIASFFWSEIQAWAVRILGEVHTLASAYSWREADILALSPARRQAYLELVAGYY